MKLFSIDIYYSELKFFDMTLKQELVIGYLQALIKLKKIVFFETAL